MSREDVVRDLKAAWSNIVGFVVTVFWIWMLAGLLPICVVMGFSAENDTGPMFLVGTWVLCWVVVSIIWLVRRWRA